jgi:hypothetical protein
MVLSPPPWPAIPPLWPYHRDSPCHPTRGLHVTMYEKIPKFIKIHSFIISRKISSTTKVPFDSTSVKIISQYVCRLIQIEHCNTYLIPICNVPLPNVPQKSHSWANFETSDTN